MSSSTVVSSSFLRRASWCERPKSLGYYIGLELSPVRVVAIQGPAPVQRTRPWFQVSPLQLPEGTQLVPAGRNYAVLPDLPMTRQDDSSRVISPSGNHRKPGIARESRSVDDLDGEGSPALALLVVAVVDPEQSLA